MFLCLSTLFACSSLFTWTSYYTINNSVNPVKEKEEVVESLKPRLSQKEKKEKNVEESPKSKAVKYVLLIENNIVMVYDGERKKLFEDTGIDAEQLPVYERERLARGVEVENAESLYEILENYSS